MTLSDLSIRRPVLATMISLALVLFGAIGYTRLAVREFPDVDPPIVSVNTQPGDSSSLACARQASSRSRMASNPERRWSSAGRSVSPRARRRR